MCSAWAPTAFIQVGAALTVPLAAHRSLLAMVTGSSPVVQVVLYLLILFSIASWGIILFKARQIRGARRKSERFIESLGDEESHDDSRR